MLERNFIEKFTIESRTKASIIRGGMRLSLDTMDIRYLDFAMFMGQAAKGLKAKKTNHPHFHG